MGSKIGDVGNANIAASWPHIVNEQALNEASILPHLLHEAEEAQKFQSSISTIERNSPGQIHENINEVDSTNNEEQQLQNMIENYSKYVIRQKQQQSTGTGNSSSRNGTGRSASHLQRKINAPQPTPMSHSHPCLFSSGGGGGGGNTKIGEEEQSVANKRSSIVVMPNNNIGGQNQPPPPPPYPQQNLHNQQHSDPRDVQIQQRRPIQQTQMDSNNGGNGPQFNRGEINNDQNVNENAQLKAQNEKLQKKCDRLEQLEMAYRKIERDYEQMLGQQERREELGRMAMKKLEKQLRATAQENEQLRAQINLIGFGPPEGGGGEHHFMLEMMPKNELLMVQMERQRLELEAQSATLEEQRRHIEVLEKALANAQERLAAKERSAVDAVAVVDKCTNLQKMLQEALEDKQRQKEQNGRQVAQLEMELTQLKLQMAKENNSQSALMGSLGRKGGGTIAAGGASPESSDEMLKLRKTLAQKDERITQLEQSLMKMQNNRRFGEEREKWTELETKAMRLELEKAEKDRRIQELLDEKMRIQMGWAEERRNLDVRVRMMEKELRHFVGSQSSLASSVGGGQFIGGGGMFLPDQTMSPFDSIRGQKSSPYLRHRSTAELPTSARGAALYEERLGIGYDGMDVMAKMEELGRKLAERRAKGGTERTTTVQRPSDLGFVQLSADDGPPTNQSNQSHSSSSDQPLNGPNQFADISPSSEDQFANGSIPMLHRQSAPSSAGSSSKKRYLVNAPSNQLAAYLEQLPEATRRRLTGDNKIGGFHLLAGIEKTAGQGRREGGCRRLIRGDHSTDIVGRKQSTDQPQMPQLAPPPNYQEAAALQQRPPPTQLIRQSCQNGPQNPQQNNANCPPTVHQMSSIDEPIQEAPPPPPPPPAYSVNIVEVNGEEGDSDTLTGHKQLVFRRSSLGNSNLIAK